MKFLILPLQFAYNTTEVPIENYVLDSLPFRVLVAYDQMHNLTEYHIRTDTVTLFVNGSIYNIPELLHQQQGECFLLDACRKDKNFFTQFRGAFCGFVYYKENNELTVFTNHTGEGCVFYSTAGGMISVTNSFNWLFEVLKQNHFRGGFQQQVAYMLLTFGRVISTDTIVDNITKLRYGSMLITHENYQYAVRNYYEFKYNKLQCAGEPDSEILKQISSCFNKIMTSIGYAVGSKYGIAELSGGLDSRTINYAAEDSGLFENMSNITFGCRNSTDVSIAKQIAVKQQHAIESVVVHEDFLLNYDKIMHQNAGLYNYIYASSTVYAYERVNRKFEYLLSGVLGDIVMRASGYIDKKTADKLYIFSAQSYKLDHRITARYSDEFQDPEFYAVYMDLQSVLQTTNLRRQYGLCFTPFSDIDLVDLFFSIPIKKRVNAKMYIQWLKKRYPESCQFIWQATNAKPSSNWLYNKLFQKIKMPNAVFDYSKNIQDPTVDKKLNMVFRQRITNPVLGNQLKEDMTELFHNGNIMEKAAVMSVLSLASKYWGDNSIVSTDFCDPINQYSNEKVV